MAWRIAWSSSTIYTVDFGLGAVFTVQGDAKAFVMPYLPRLEEYV